MCAFTSQLTAFCRRCYQLLTIRSLGRSRRYAKRILSQITIVSEPAAADARRQWRATHTKRQALPQKACRRLVEGPSNTHGSKAWVWKTILQETQSSAIRKPARKRNSDRANQRICRGVGWETAKIRGRGELCCANKGGRQKRIGAWRWAPDHTSLARKSCCGLSRRVGISHILRDLRLRRSSAFVCSLRRGHRMPVDLNGQSMLRDQRLLTSLLTNKLSFGHTGYEQTAPKVSFEL